MPSTPADASRCSLSRRCVRPASFLGLPSSEAPFRPDDRSRKTIPRLTEREAELLVVRDRALKIINDELWREGCHTRLHCGRSHRCLLQQVDARLSGSPSNLQKKWRVRSRHLLHAALVYTLMVNSPPRRLYLPLPLTTYGEA